MFFLRISRFSDLDWRSYTLPEDAEWREYDSLDDMVAAGATVQDGLCGLPWPRPWVDDDDIVIPAGHPMRIDVDDTDITCEMLVEAGYFVRVYVGELVRTIQDGVIFRPGCTEEEAEEIIDEFPELCVSAEEIVENSGLIDVRRDISRPGIDDWAWNRKQGSPHDFSLF